MRYLAIVGATALLAAPVQANTITDLFSSFWVLGDSLSDNGNTAFMVGTLNAAQTDPIEFPPGSPLQQPGVASDGFTWAKEFNDGFAAAGKSTANLSFGSARAADDGQGPPDLGAQIAADKSFTTSFSFNLNPGDPTDIQTISGTVPKYADGMGGLLDRQTEWGSDPLVTVFIGGNDFLDTARDIALGVGAPADLLPQVIGTTFNAVSSNINALIGAGVTDFMVMNMPDFSMIPQFDGDGALLGAALGNAAAGYNALLEQYLSGLRDTGIKVTSVDIFSALSDETRLASFGITDIENACVFSVNPLEQDCTGFLYFDNIHPTAQGHAAIAALARENLNETYGLQPVPLPAPALMLISALGGTILMRRRRKAA
jgi:phospholipase/lecithinase/hemolysin